MATPKTMLPPGVELTGDRGVYTVASASRPNITPHRVDVEMRACDCESFTKGKSYKARKAAGGLTWDNACPHLRLAWSAHGVIRSLEEAASNLQKGNHP